VSGVQVAPSEIEILLLEHPAKYIIDVAVAGVQGVRMADEKVPKAWIVLSEEGKKKGRKLVMQELDAYVKDQLSSPKWLRGGITVVKEVSGMDNSFLWRKLLMHSCLTRSRSLRRVRCCDAF
jgi:acyl-CoA synthetase (AMP-forming)/AMP-acid ligase II